MKFILVYMIFLVILFANDVSYNRGEMLYFSHGCSSCHGPDAEGSLSYPKLAHKKQSYLVKKLKDFRSGKADSVSKQMMAQFAYELNDENIEDLTYFFANHEDSNAEDVDDSVLGGFGS